MNRTSFAAGTLAATAARALLPQLLLRKFRADVRALNAGDYGPLLAGYADDATLRFVDGDSRWAGDHVGKPAIERFYQEFVGARLQGEILDLWVAGPPWALKIVVRFKDGATAPDGTELYANSTVLLVQMRWPRWCFTRTSTRTPV